MQELKLDQLSEISGGEGFWKGYFTGKVVDYVAEGTIHPSAHSKKIARRAYGSKWKSGDRLAKNFRK